MERKAGRLYICSTPIGNLADITHRAVEVMRQVACIAAEDTRHTRKLLAHYGISTPLVSLHEHNEAQRAPALIERMLRGDDVALVSDAGTPLISDPGYKLVQAALEAGIEVVPVPGASALLAALVGAGLPPHPFYFGGFLPRRRSERRRLLEALRPLGATLVFYEVPHRLQQTLSDLAQLFPERRAAVARELTKVHEEFLRGTTAELAAHFTASPARGECVIVIEGAARADQGGCVDDDEIRRALLERMSAGMEKKEAIRAVAALLSVERRRVYQVAIDLYDEGDGV